MAIRTSVAVACIGLLLSGAALFLAQDKDFQLRTNVNLVVVPVSVRDNNGSLRTNLTQEDFTLYEDNKEQKISNFSTDPVPLSAAIVVDTGVSGGELRRLDLVLGTLLKQFQESDEIAAYRYDHVVTKLSDFTNNQQAVAQSFESVRAIAETKPDAPPTGTLAPPPLRWILDRTQIGTNGAPTVAGAPGTPTAPPPSPRAATQSKALHDALYTAVADLEKRPINHRRIVILLSNGQVTGNNEHSEAETQTRILRSNVQVYAVGTDLKLFEHMTVLNGYAHSSGGAVFDGGRVESMATSLGQAVEQGRNQYVLGYTSSNEVAGTRPVFRRIEVKIREPKFKATYRNGYLQYPN
jgi:VWFA-related protein